jgi:hypothetical protein
MRVLHRRHSVFDNDRLLFKTASGVLAIRDAFLVKRISQASFEGRTMLRERRMEREEQPGEGSGSGVFGCFSITC